jgi:hypothetical protein
MIRFKNRIQAEQESKRQIWLKENTANLTLEQLLSLLEYEASNMSTQKYNECLGMLLFKISKIDKKSFYDTPDGVDKAGHPEYSEQQLQDASDAVHIQDYLLNAFKTAERQMSVEYNRALLED